VKSAFRLEQIAQRAEFDDQDVGHVRSVVGRKRFP
jgi:hypothetical protein